MVPPYALLSRIELLLFIKLGNKAPAYPWRDSKAFNKINKVSDKINIAIEYSSRQLKNDNSVS